MERLRSIAPYLAAFGLVLLVAGLFVVTSLIPQISNKNVGWGLTLVGAVLLLAWPLLRPQDLSGALRSRQGRFGGNALALVLAVLAILGAVNFISSRFYYVADLTANKQFSISRQTVQILEGLKEPVQLTAIMAATEDQSARELAKLVDKYKQRTTQITYTRLDPIRDLQPVRGIVGRLGLGPNIPGRALVAEAGGKHAVVYSFDEQALTEVIVKATRGKERSVAFSTGHGELGIEATGEGGGYNTARQALEQEGYKVGTYNAAVSPTLSAATTDALVIAGPARPFQPAEAQKITDYIAKGGKVLLMLDVGVDSGLESVLKAWDIRLNNDIAIDMARNVGSPTGVAVTDNGYQTHTITKDLRQYTTLLPNSRTFTTGQPITGSLQATVFLKSSDNAWGETDIAGLKASKPPAKDANDTAAPLNLAVAAEGGKDFGRLVVFGTSVMASDALLTQVRGVANLDVFLNAVNWLTQEEDLISIRPKDPNERPLKPPTSPFLLLLTTVFLAPLTVLGIGAWVWWQRR